MHGCSRANTKSMAMSGVSRRGLRSGYASRVDGIPKDND